MHPKLKRYLEHIDVNQVSEQRKESLLPLRAYIKEALVKNNEANLTFICTHNSRRSHFGQVWAKIAAENFGVKGIHTFSGGTEATACNSRTIEALRRAGCEISSNGTKDNPVYSISYDQEGPSLKAFSKVYDDEENPQKNFGAILTCDNANENCPLISGADVRLPILYIDPKVSDDTPEEVATYDERCRQIATEMYWVFAALSA